MVSRLDLFRRKMRNFSRFRPKICTSKSPLNINHCAKLTRSHNPRLQIQQTQPYFTQSRTRIFFGYINKLSCRFCNLKLWQGAFAYDGAYPEAPAREQSMREIRGAVAGSRRLVMGDLNSP
jgi:hypothetical protein